MMMIIEPINDANHIIPKIVFNFSGHKLFYCFGKIFSLKQKFEA